MAGECFNCNGVAPERYTLLFESGRILEGKPLCSACVAGFRAERWIEVVEGPVVVRGEDEE
jgi:hypothetical protein